MTLYRFIEDFWPMVLFGYSTVMLLRFGKRGWQSTLDDFSPRLRWIDLWVVQTIVLLAMTNHFLHHPDKPPLLILQLSSLVLMTMCGMTYFRRREMKPKLLRYTSLGSVVLVVVLAVMHS